MLGPTTLAKKRSFDFVHRALIKDYRWRLIKGNAKKAMAPKVTIINVWQLQTIQPKAKLESLLIPNETKTKETA
jgi:hypothetical protein